MQQHYKNEHCSWNKAEQTDLDRLQSTEEGLTGSCGLCSLGEMSDFCQTERTNSNQAYQRKAFKTVGLAIAKWPQREMMDKNQEACAIEADKSYHGIGGEGMDSQQDQPSTSQYAFPVQCPMVTIGGLAKWTMENLLDFFGIMTIFCEKHILGFCLLTPPNDPNKKTR